MPDTDSISPLIQEARTQEIAERAAARALLETFRLLGLNINDMADVNNLRDDFRFMRRQRSASEARRTEASKSLTTALVGGVVGMLISALTWVITLVRHQP
jgi:hypothetical protein